MNLSAKIESILFWKGEPISIKRLSEILSVTEEEINKGLSELSEQIKDRGISISRLENDVQIVTNTEMSPIIEKLTKEELIRDLGKAGLETLSILLYKGPLTRADIDYIRGVNSQFILRNLLIRGLVERVNNPKDSRSFLYKPTFELLSYLGVSRIDELPEFMKIKSELDQIEKDVSNSDENKE